MARVDLTGLTDSAAGGGLTAELEVLLSMCPADGGLTGVAPGDTSIDDDGTIRLGFETPNPVVPASDRDVELEPGEATVDSDGTVSVTVSASVPTVDGQPDGSPVNGDSQVGEQAENGSPGDDVADLVVSHQDRDVPVFEDAELLAAVYGACDTFAEMAEALEMDVTAETVRRYMVDHGIHEPRSYSTTEGDPGEGSTEERADRESQVLLTDGFGLPEDVPIDTVVESVRTSKTLHEVTDDIGLEREDTLEMLRDLDLLEFVVGRLALAPERDVDREVIVERLGENAGPELGGRP